MQRPKINKCFISQSRNNKWTHLFGRRLADKELCKIFIWDTRSFLIQKAWDEKFLVMIIITKLMEDISKELFVIDSLLCKCLVEKWLY